MTILRYRPDVCAQRSNPCVIALDIALVSLEPSGESVALLATGFHECPGHLGHVELHVPLYNPTLFGELHRLLKLKCFSCHRLRVAASRSRLLSVKLMLLDVGRVDDAMRLQSLLESAASGDEPTLLTPGDAEGRRTGRAKRKAAAAADDDGANDDTAAAALARQARILDDYELECVVQGGDDVGCGLSSSSAGRYSAHVRSILEAEIKSYLRYEQVAA